MVFRTTLQKENFPSIDMVLLMTSCYSQAPVGSYTKWVIKLWVQKGQNVLFIVIKTAFKYLSLVFMQTSSNHVTMPLLA